LPALSQIELPSLGEPGPDELRSLLTVLMVLTAAGFLTGIFGHVIKSRTLVAVGVTLVMLGAVAFVVAVGRYG
jgi:hypothetical protein